MPPTSASDQVTGDFCPSAGPTGPTTGDEARLMDGRLHVAWTAWREKFWYFSSFGLNMFGTVYTG